MAIGVRKIERFNIALAITGLFPEADSSRDFIVMDDGYGNQWIAEWHLDAPIPTKEELREGYKKIPRGGSEETKAGEPKGAPIRIRPRNRGDYSGAGGKYAGCIYEGVQCRRYVAPADKARNGNDRGCTGLL